MKHEVKVGDRFKLGPWEWTVQEIYSASINAYHHKGGDFYHKLTLWLTDADSLDWIKPEVTFTQEQVEVLKGQIQHILCSCKNDHDAEDMFIDFLDSHTEEDKPLE